MGYIGACNVLSDLYAAGVTNCNSLLMLLAESTEIENKAVRSATTTLLMKGFAAAAKAAGTTVSGGQSVRGAWPLIGGAASSVVPASDLLDLSRAEKGNVAVLTKPLGMQVAVNVHQWWARREKSDCFAERAKFLDETFPPEFVPSLYEKAAKQMMRLNKHAAELMHKYDARACTDVTGFGILGHAMNLVSSQHKRHEITLEIHTMPILEGMKTVNEKIPFRLMQGLSAETSGGLLIVFKDLQTAKQFCDEIQKDEGFPAWIIGEFVERKEDLDAEIVNDVKVIEY